MTRISLKEQYDNSSVIKQLADLTDQIVDYDERITEATETANTAKTAADAAKTTADNAAAKNTVQDGRLDSIETVNTAQEQEIAGIKLKDAQQDVAIDELATENDEQDAKIAAIQTKDSEQDAKIATIQAKDTEQDLSISSILDTDTKQDTAIDALKTITNTLTNEVISAVNVVDGTQNGSIMVRLTDTGGSVISSPSYPWGQVATFALKQGNEAGYVRGVLTLSDGEVIESNDFQILQIQESDVYVTSITLTPYPTTGKLGGEIGYSNGNVAQINIIDVPTAPGVTTNINDLLSRMGVVESGVNDLDVRVKAIEDTPGVSAFTNLSRGTILGSAEDGKVSANDDGTGSVSGWSDVVKSAQISDMLTKTTAASTYLTKTDAAATYESIEDAAQIESVANDAQTKANGCFNTVALNSAEDGLIFKTPSDQQTEIILPATGISGIDFYTPIEINTVSLTSTTASSDQVTLIYGTPSLIGVEDSICFVRTKGTPQYLKPKSTARFYCSLNGWNATDLSIFTNIVNKIVSRHALKDGVFAVNFIPVWNQDEIQNIMGSYTWPTSSGMFGTLSTSYFVYFTISDGEVTAVSRSSALSFSDCPFASFNKIAITNIEKTWNEM